MTPREETDVSFYGFVPLDHRTCNHPLISFRGSRDLYLRCRTTAKWFSFRDQHTGQPQPAKLTWNVPQQFVYLGSYDNSNETLSLDAWNAISINSGSVALKDSYAESLGLPIAQRFHWDNSKRLYFLNGHHSVHFLVR